MAYTPPKTVTVTFPYDEYNEVCNTLQLIAVLGIDLYVQGIQPDKKKLLAAFTTMSKAGMEAYDNAKNPETKATNEKDVR